MWKAIIVRMPFPLPKRKQVLPLLENACFKILYLKKLLRQLLHLDNEMTIFNTDAVKIKDHLAVRVLCTILLRWAVFEIFDDLLPFKKTIDKINEIYSI